MTWMAETFERRTDLRKLMPDAMSVVMLGLNYGPEIDPLAALSRLRPGPFPSTRAIATITMFSRASSKNSLAASWSRRRAGKGGRESVRRHGAAAREAPCCTRRARLARQAHQSGVAPIWLLAVPGRLPDEPRLAARRAGIGPLRTMPRLPRRVSDRRVSGALSTRRARLHFLSHDRARGPKFRGSFEPRSAIASMGATTAWPSARGTSSRALDGKRNLRRAPTSMRRPWPNSPASTMRRSGRFSPAARSSGSAGRASCAM